MSDGSRPMSPSPSVNENFKIPLSSIPLTVCIFVRPAFSIIGIIGYSTRFLQELKKHKTGKKIISSIFDIVFTEVNLMQIY